MHGACNSKSKFGPAHWGPMEGSKGQITSKTVNFKDFLYHILCVFSQMKDTKHIRWDFLYHIGHSLGVVLWGA